MSKFFKGFKNRKIKKIKIWFQNKLWPLSRSLHYYRKHSKFRHIFQNNRILTNLISQVNIFKYFQKCWPIFLDQKKIKLKIQWKKYWKWIVFYLFIYSFPWEALMSGGGSLMWVTAKSHISKSVFSFFFFTKRSLLNNMKLKRECCPK